MTDDELRDLQQILQRLVSRDSIHRVINLYKNSYSQGFVLYAATWLQRNSSGRPDWSGVLSSIAASDLELPERYELVRNGLKLWGLNVHSTKSTKRYLDTLACQGGFPRSDLLKESSSQIDKYFEKVLRYFEQFQHSVSLQEVAHRQLSELPITLQQDAFADLVSSLIERLLDWKTQFGLGDVNDALKVLDNHHTPWRNELPFLVMDDEAETLIEKLLRRTSQLKRREQNPVRVRRQLIPVGDNYRLIAQIYVAKDIHPQDLERQFKRSTLPSSFLLSTNTANGNQFKTASFDLRTGPSDEWQVISHERTVSDLIAADELRFIIKSEGKHILDGTYYRGEPLEPEIPWVFEISGSSLNYLGQGSVTSSKDRLIVVSKSRPSPSNEFASVRDDGALIDTNLRVYEISGHVEVKALAGSYRIQSQSSENREFSVRVDTLEYTDVEASKPVYLGPPVINIFKNGDTQVVPRDQFYWHAEGANSLIGLNSPLALGSGAIIWQRDGQLLWEKRCVLLPIGFKPEVIRESGTRFKLIIHNAKKPEIGMPPDYENWLEGRPSYEANELQVNFVAKDPDANQIELNLVWRNEIVSQCRLGFLISFKFATLKDRRGNPYNVLERGGLTIDDLPNLQLAVRSEAAVTEVELTAALMSIRNSANEPRHLVTDRRAITSTWVDGKLIIRGNQLSDFSEGLLSLTDQLETFLKFELWVNREPIAHDIPDLYHYKHDPKFAVVNGVEVFTLIPTPTLTSLDDPVLYLSPIWDFNREPIELRPQDTQANTWYFHLPAENSLEYGPWLIWGPAQLSVRPRLKKYSVPPTKRDPTQLGVLGAKLISALDLTQDEEPYVEKLQPNTLPYRVKYLDPKDGSSLRGLNNSIKNVGQNIYHPDWKYFDGLIEYIDSLDPLALYAMTSLQRNHRALVALLFRYPDHFHSMWKLAPRLGLSWYSIAPQLWIEVIQQYFLKYQNDGAQLKDYDVDLYWKFVFEHFEKFEAKGPYFQYLLDLATDRPRMGLKGIGNDRPISIYERRLETILNHFEVQLVALKDRHDGQLLDRFGTKNTTEKFLSEVEQTWSSSKLPPALDHFFRVIAPPSHSAPKRQNAHALTLAFPLKLGFFLSNNHHDVTAPKNMYLNFALMRLDEFDRAWLQNALIVAHLACKSLSL